MIDLRKNARALLRPALMVGLIASALPAQAAEDELSKLAQELIRLRGDVERLYDHIESNQRQHKNRMAGLSQRRAELEGQIQRQELDLRRTQKQINELNEKAKEATDAAMRLQPVAEELIQILKGSVNRGLPFTIAERDAELSELEKKLASNEVSTPRAINQLWSFVEDELRLCRENGLFRQSIVLDGKEQLADVIRLGMAMLFFKTEQGDYGYAERQGDSWTFSRVKPGQLEAAKKLFGLFERQLRTGYFEVPYALNEVTL